MPAILNYPGVYIEELPSAVHTVTGVATSIAAFVGWTPKGLITEAVLVRSWIEFARKFGGFDSRSYLGYAVNQFFGNGGQEAYIVRLVSGAKTASCSVGGLTLYANSPGDWANGLKITVTPNPNGFSLKIQDQVSNVLESFVNLTSTSALPSINTDSQYITFQNPDGAGPGQSSIVVPSTPASCALVGGDPGEVLQPKDGLNVTDGQFETVLKDQIGLLDRVDIFNLLCVPGEADETTIAWLAAYCAPSSVGTTSSRSYGSFYIADCPQTATSASLQNGPIGAAGSSLSSSHFDYAAYYYPWVQAPDPLANNRPRLFPPSGFIAGTYAGTDVQRGVWKAPAGIETAISGVNGLQAVLTDSENGSLNVKGVNCLRQFKTFGNVVWGARTLQGSDEAGSQWKYVPIRRTALHIESSLYRGTQWVVFEPNDERLWGQVRMNLEVFMQDLFHKGAFQGTTRQQAYFVKCDSENNPQSSIDQGIVNVHVGFAPLYPAEFVVIQIQQMMGQL